MAMNKTLEYYNNNAEDFVKNTVNADLLEVQEKFLSLLPQGGKILDFGCGSGRDAKYFCKNGFTVDAVDGSEELCRLAGKYAGISVRKMLFSELNETEEYDGIWACSSILHLPSAELRDVLLKMRRALKGGGYIYTSFKYGEYEGIRDGRYFTDFTAHSFKTYIADMQGIEIKELWITGDVRPGRGNEKWLNLILQKSDIH